MLADSQSSDDYDGVHSVTDLNKYSCLKLVPFDWLHTQHRVFRFGDVLGHDIQQPLASEFETGIGYLHGKLNEDAHSKSRRVVSNRV